MSDERRKSAAAWALAETEGQEQYNVAVEAYLAGDDAGARREREAIVAWIMAEHDRWMDPHDKANFRGIAEGIGRGEHRGGE